MPENSRQILVLEDQPLIAMDLEAMLENAGFTSSVLTSRAEAIEFLERETPLVAVLDITLRDGQCIQVAEALTERGVPLIVCSGSQQEGAHDVFNNCTWLGKPTAEGDLIAAVREAVELREFQQTLESKG